MRSPPTAVLGAGAWGTALANAAASRGRRVLLWGRDRAAMADIASSRENTRYLPGVPLLADVAPTGDTAALGAAETVLAAIPAQALRAVLTELAPALRRHAAIVVCAKGIERTTGKFVCDIAADILPENPVAVLSGPSFAADVARGLPTAVTLACADDALARRLSEDLASANLRIYSTTDVRGVEIGGAAKNVLAIACGIAAGAQLGASAGAALVARGFAELTRFGRALGARPETLMGLSGLGDLVLTCNSPQSRNFALGHSLGEGETAAAILALGKLAEGAGTAQILVELARRHSIDVPICAGVADILAGKASVTETITQLLARPQRRET